MNVWFYVEEASVDAGLLTGTCHGSPPFEGQFSVPVHQITYWTSEYLGLWQSSEQFSHKYLK